MGWEFNDLERVIDLERVLGLDLNRLGRILDLEMIWNVISMIWNGLSSWNGFAMGFQ